MLRYLATRLSSMLVSLAGVTVLVFLMVHLIPGNPARAMLGERASEASVRELEERLGLDDSLPVQYGRFIAKVVRLDLGRSIKTNRRVTDEIAARFPATVELTLAAMCVAVVGGILLGVLEAARRGSALDYIGMILALAGVSIPIFCLGLVLILVFSAGLEWLPVGGRIGEMRVVPTVTGFMLLDAITAGDMAALRSAAAHLVLPAVTLGTVPLAIVSRMTRSSVLDVLDQDYIRTAHAKGLRRATVLFRHALRNALIPVITVVGLEFGYLLGGAVMTETIFSWPGLGRWLLLAVYARDMPAIQGGILFVAVVFMVITLVVDLLYAVIDPRVRVTT